jgi:hypothetical protein
LGQMFLNHFLVFILNFLVNYFCQNKRVHCLDKDHI